MQEEEDRQPGGIGRRGGGRGQHPDLRLPPEGGTAEAELGQARRELLGVQQLDRAQVGHKLTVP
jgi:hypothetical protein